MKFLTQNQIEFIFRKKIKIGGMYPFPSLGFNAYRDPKCINGGYVSTNYMSRSLMGQFFLVKDIKDGLCKGDFYQKPMGEDFYMLKEELSRRKIFEIVFLFLITLLPFLTYNFFKLITKKLDILK